MKRNKINAPKPSRRAKAHPPAKISSGGEKNDAPVSKPYDPNSEKEQRIQTAALHYELLRRNAEFKEVAARWIADPKFRIGYAASNDYRHPQLHFARCALDWMISGKERVELAGAQLAAGQWFHDNRFNFGPLIAAQSFHDLDVSVKNLADSFSLQPLPAATPLRLDRSWPDTPGAFRNQYILAVHDGGEFQVVTNHMHDAGVYLRWAAHRIYKNDAPEKLPEIIQRLRGLGQYLHDLAEFQNIFAVPNAYCPPGKFNEYLDAIRTHCSEAGQVVGKYSPHASWLGTRDQWRFFLMAEAHGWDIKNPQHLYQMARVYSEELRQRRYDRTARMDAKQHGFKGTAVPSKVITARRSTVRKVVTAIQEWIANIYPTERWM